MSFAGGEGLEQGYLGLLAQENRRQFSWRHNVPLKTTLILMIKSDFRHIQKSLN